MRGFPLARSARVNPKGFTLIELLVVITILAILAAIGIPVYSGVQKSARMAKRVSDLKSIQMALDLYRADSDSYPLAQTWRSECVGGGSFPADEVVPGLAPKYLQSFPSDPRMKKLTNESCYMYISNEDGSGYKIIDYGVAELSPEDYLKQRMLIDPARDGGSDPCKADGNLPQAFGFFTYNACDL